MTPRGRDLAIRWKKTRENLKKKHEGNRTNWGLTNRKKRKSRRTRSRKKDGVPHGGKDGAPTHSKTKGFGKGGVAGKELNPPKPLKTSLPASLDNRGLFFDREKKEGGLVKKVAKKN